MAGIIQGSARGKSIHSQGYRAKIKRIFAESAPEFVVYDPFDGNEDSVNYELERGKSVFNGSLDKIRDCDLMIAYLPEASMGTAIEMWECHHLGIPIWTITDMKENWVVKFCSEKIFDSVDSLFDEIRKLTVAN